MKLMREILGLESIEFQSKNKGKELELLISNFRSNSYSAHTAQKSKEVKLIEGTVLRLFGLNIKLIVDTDILAAIELPLVKLNHIFFEEEIREYLIEDIFKNKNKIKNKITKANVDIKNAYISGYFSEVTCNVYLSWNDLLKDNKITDSEVTAIFLHELGHGFTTFEYMSRFVATNQAMAALSNTLLHNDSVKEYEFILQKIGKEFLNDENRFDSVKDIKDSKVVIPFVFSTIIKETKSELGTAFYDRAACEYLADQFVSRLQYGKDIVTGLDKLYGWYDPSKTPWLQLIYDLMGILIAAGVAILLSGGLNIFTICTGIFISILYYKGNKFSNYDFTYDDLKIRYTRVKEQLIQDLKLKHYSSSEISEKIKDIEQIDKVIKETYVTYNWLTNILKAVVPSQKRTYEKYMLQRTLEELASNSLFVKSAQLKVLSK